MADLNLRTLERLAAAGDQAAVLRVLAAGDQADDQALAAPTTCPHCSRLVTRVELACDGSDGEYNCVGGDLPPGMVYGVESNQPVKHAPCNGTGRVPWPWHGEWDGTAGRLDLAARAGSPVARLLTGPPRTIRAPDRPEGFMFGDWELIDAFALNDWLSSFSRWRGANLIAVLAAGWAALKVHEGQCVSHGGDYCPERCYHIRCALQSATEYARCGCQRSRGVWRTFCGEQGAGAAPLEWAAPAGWRYTAKIAARKLGESQIRAAITDALVAWALQGEVVDG